MSETSAKRIIEGIATGKAGVIRYIYERYFGRIRKLILMNKGSDEDARDTFQEALFLIYRRINRHGLELKGSFGSYLYSVCKLLWMRELRERSYKKYEQWYTGDIEAPVPVNKKLESVKMKIFDRHFNELSEECQKILYMHFNELNIGKIAEIMGYKSIEQIKEKKYNCKKTLMNKIYKNPEYKKVSDEIYLAG